MKRWSFFAYGVFNHLLFLAVFAYMACFVGSFLTPKSIDTPASVSITAALVIDLALVLLFGLQHSIMARPAFKAVWTRVVPKPIERSTYVFVSNLVVILLVWQWQGIEVPVWDVQQPLGRAVLWGLFAVGWLLVPAASLMIDHFDLFGTRQVWLYLRRRENVPQPFRTPLLYQHVRHPLYVGWAMAFWATPTMTVGHLLLAGTMTLYMGVAALIEERDLVNYFGDHYRAYQRRVPMFIPRFDAGSPANKVSPAPVGTQSLSQCRR